MKGLDIAELFYREYGVPLIAERFHGYEDRIAAGLIGDGSDCYGFDDQFSRDHDWGPGFCLWLTDEDLDEIGEKLARAYQALPIAYMGYTRNQGDWGDGRVGVFGIGQFYQKHIGLAAAPTTLGQWIRLPENYLAACTAGRIFRDDLGAFSKIQAGLKGFYPEDVRRAKLGARCMQLGQSGQYNFWRSVKRSEFYAAHYAVVKFCNDAMAVVFLLNKQYAPFYKWIHRAVKGLPVLGQYLHDMVLQLTNSSKHEETQHLMSEICGMLINEFYQQGLSQINSESLVDHGQAIHDAIADDELRRVDVWYG